MVIGKEEDLFTKTKMFTHDKDMLAHIQANYIQPNGVNGHFIQSHVHTHNILSMCFTL